ncbi:hypothetical protein AMS68_007206 [Peltaster fructicola]|uniref:Peptidase S8/S53 domain-containing protein n=1 Tax=Peltaster fructicola TaxID=286661 RepID=A0A6H0Y4B5_9PEZI|nr:hypothetical protein AMS68_007206 [Peltaster fructicola]
MSNSVNYLGNTVILPQQEPNISRDSQSTNYIYVQTHGPAIDERQKQELRSLGVELREYLGNNTYLCHYPPTDLAPVRQLSYVRAVNVFHRALKVDPDLKDIAVPGYINVLLHKDASAEQIAPVIAAIDGAAEDDLDTSYRKIRVRVDNATALADISRLDSVQSIEPVREAVLGNNLARVDMHAVLPAPLADFAGQGQVISVNDSGFDLGGVDGQAPTDVHPAFGNKVLATIAVGRAGKTNDPNGHGTHVCGSAVGNGQSTTMGGTIQGTAHGADLVVTSLLNDAGGLTLPTNLYQLFQTPYGKYNSRVSSNSWYTKSTTQLKYDDQAKDVDSFCWDNKDCVVVFCAGNEGGQFGTKQIGGVSAAKNCITVGATRGSRPNDGVKFNAAKAAVDPRATAGFSSLGPGLEGRIKPDVAAPGTAILSTASRDPAITADKLQQYGSTTDRDWMFMSGTSMSTPLVSGCCAILRQAVSAADPKTHHNPSSALIKALLINGSLSAGEKHDDSSKAMSAPSSFEGFGYVDVARSVVPKETYFADNAQGLLQGEQMDHDLVFDSLDKRTAVKVTLVYTDRPGEALQNLLTLSLKATNNTSVKDTSQLVENNVQQIILRKVNGPLKIHVQADRISRAGERQPYAVVWRFLD